jgi:MYXO-CTERM domain-containing protein
MKSISNRLGVHFAACAAVTAGVVASQADAALVYHSLNQVIPANGDGIYFNLVTQAQDSGPVAGWDMNPYGSTSLTFFGSTNPTAQFVNIGAYTSEVSAIAQGFFISSALPTNNTVGTDRFNSTKGGYVYTDGYTGDWSLDATNIIGFKFTGELGETLYGWARFQLGASEAERTFIDYAYDNAGGGVYAGVVPAPGALALIGLAGFAARRRRA